VNKVYAWYPHDGNLGHASMDISFGGGPGVAEYVSFWPKGVIDRHILVTGGGSTNYTYPQDVKAQGCDPHATIEIDCLDENKMRAFWLSHLPGARYSLLFKNCANFVCATLLEGGAAFCDAVNRFTGSHSLWTPYEVVTLAELTADNSDVIKKQRVLGQPEQPHLGYWRYMGR
jgi:hypothetical protein